MHFLLSPAKTLHLQPGVPARIQPSVPRFMPQAQQLVAILKTKTAAQLGALMDISPALSALNVQRYRDWRLDPEPASSPPAILTFNGDVYEGLAAQSWSVAMLRWAQQHVSILSGLYGVLRPLDQLQAYRLEMGTVLAHPQAPNLYRFWGETLLAYFQHQLTAQGCKVVVNLASQEYAKVLARGKLSCPVVDCVFEDWKNDRYKIISFYAKRARGLMLRYAAEQRCSRTEQLQKFNLEGYQFDPAVSQPARMVFRRRLEQRIIP
jgi:uncharacterized protein